MRAVFEAIHRKIKKLIRKLEIVAKTPTALSHAYCKYFKQATITS